MHITILALGSHGDVLPFATLGKGLKTVGHQIRFVTFENFREMVVAHGLNFWPIQGDSQAILIFELGLGPKPIPVKELTIARLAQAIITAMTDAEMRRKPAVVGNKIGQEAGLLQAVDFDKPETR